MFVYFWMMMCHWCCLHVCTFLQYALLNALEERIKSLARQCIDIVECMHTCE